MDKAEAAWAEVAKKYTIHPETIAATAIDLEAKLPPISSIPVEQARENMLHQHRNINGEDPPFAGTTEEIEAGGVPATLYRPASLPSGDGLVVMVYFHGGSLMMGSRETHDASVKALAERSGVIILSIEYRLLPRPNDPWAPFDDAVAATRWAMTHRDVFSKPNEGENAAGIGSKVKIGVGGDSAGGQLVMGVTYEVGSGLDFMVLVYPTADMNTDLPSCKEFNTTPAFNATALKWRFGVTNAPILDAEKNPKLNAAVRQDLGASPPAVIVLADLDPLRDAGTRLGERLKSEGVLVRTHLIQGVPHGFFSLPGVYKTTTAQAFAHISDFLHKFHS